MIFFIRLRHPLITDLCHMTDTVFRCLCTDTVTHTKRRIMNGRQRTKQAADDPVATFIAQPTFPPSQIIPVTVPDIFRTAYPSCSSLPPSR